MAWGLKLIQFGLDQRAKNEFLPVFDDLLVGRRDVDVVLLLVRAEVAAKLARLGFVEVDDAQLGPAAATLEAGSVKLQQTDAFYHNLKSTKVSAQLLR